MSTPDSQTHRLCFFKNAPTNVPVGALHMPGVPVGKHVGVPHFVADEVEELREFVRFLYPPKGQDRFKLHRPDVLDLRWTVAAKDEHGLSHIYAAGDTPLQAVKNARLRLQAEDEAERTTVPYSLEPQQNHD
jgi:hypothetical protein